MKVASMIERNRRMKEIAKRASQRVERAVVHSVDGNRVNIRLNNSPTLVRHVEVAGDIAALQRNSEVPILWKEGRPVVLAGQPVGSLQELESHAPDPFIGMLASSTLSKSVANSTDGVFLEVDQWEMDCYRFNRGGADKFYIPVNGLYQVVCNIQWSPNTTAGRRTRLILNGEAEIARASHSGLGVPIQAHSLVEHCFLHENSYLQVELWQNTSGALSTNLAPGPSVFIRCLEAA